MPDYSVKPDKGAMNSTVFKGMKGLADKMKEATSPMSQMVSKLEAGSQTAADAPNAMTMASAEATLKSGSSILESMDSMKGGGEGPTTGGWKSFSGGGGGSGAPPGGLDLHTEKIL